MPISFSQVADLQCPKCSQHFSAEVWLIVDATERLDLAERCQAGKIHEAVCPQGHVGTLSAPLLYHDRIKEKLLLALPTEIDEQQVSQINAQLTGQLLENIPAPHPDYLNQTQVVPQQLLSLALADDPQAALAEQLAHDPAKAKRLALAQTLQTFIQADSWNESQRILESQPELLSAEADQVLADLIEAARDQKDANAEKILIEHRELLAEARNNGVAAAFAHKYETTPAAGAPSLPSEMAERLRELKVQSPEDLERALREHPDLAEAVKIAAMADSRLAAIQALGETHSPQEVLHTTRVYPFLVSDEGLAFIRLGIANARTQGKEDMAQHLEERLNILLEFKQSGLSPADVARMEQMTQALDPETAAALQELLQQDVDTPAKLEQALRERPALREKLELAAKHSDVAE